MRVLDKISSLSARVCPGYDQAGDLASIATLAMYAVSIEPVGAIAVSVMMSASIYNTVGMVLESVPMAAPKAEKPAFKDTRANVVKGDSLESDLSRKLENNKDESKSDKSNIFRL